MDMNRMTTKSQEVVRSALSEAVDRGNPELMPSHLLRAVISQPEGIGGALVARAGADRASLLEDLAQTIASYPQVSGNNQPGLNRRTSDLYKHAEKESERLKDDFISVEHFLLAAARQDKDMQAIFDRHGLAYDKLLHALQEVRGHQRVSDQDPEGKFQALDKYTRDLTRLARDNKIDPVIGRDEEIRRVMQVLSRRTKNNPILIGEPGVGKTAIAEGIAQRIASREVPESLNDKRLVSLDLASLVAGAKYRGEFEDRLKAVMKEVQGAAGGIIMFIDELHTLVGAGAAEGAMDAANMLKPALARGELRAIGATTLEEYRKHIEKDAALARRFQPVIVDQPSVEATIGILRGLKERYEVHHGIRIRDAALVSAAVLSQRYIPERFLPDKAIDLVDEAASKIKMEIDSLPLPIDQLERRLVELGIEEQALSREPDAGSESRLEEVRRSLANLSSERDEARAQWLREKEMIAEIRDMKAQVEALRVEQDKASRRGDLGKAAEIQYGSIPGLEKSLETHQKDLDALQGDSGYLKEEVTEEDVAQVVAKWTGIPVSKMLESEMQKLVQMEENLEQRVIGQPDALQAVANAVRRSRAGFSEESRPIGSFLFLGPTGVGKTETARALAEFLFDDDRAMIRIDMSEYMERHSVSRLIGAPPGYVGYDEGGQLTEPVRRRPYSVVLFDEIEKAHPDVFNTLLQVLDDGRLTDGQGRTVDFRNTVVIATSNLGSEQLARVQEEEDLGQGALSERLQSTALEALRSHFRPEFINRLDEIVVYHRLGRRDLRRVVDIQLRNLQARVQARGLTLEVDDRARDFLAKVGFDPQFGARPLKRAIQRRLEDPLASAVLRGEFAPGTCVVVTAGDDDLELSGRSPEKPAGEDEPPQTHQGTFV